MTSTSWDDIGSWEFIPCFDSHAWHYLLASLAPSTSMMGRDLGRTMGVHRIHIACACSRKGAVSTF